MDEFGHKEFMMNVGDEKGLLLDEEVRRRNPTVAIELGGYDIQCAWGTRMLT